MAHFLCAELVVCSGGASARQRNGRRYCDGLLQFRQSGLIAAVALLLVLFSVGPSGLVKFGSWAHSYH